MNGQRVRAVMLLELRIQRREPLTVLYVLVLSLLAAAFAAAGPVELVRNRGAVPRDSAWSLMMASTALTAFGQVITTMVAATVVLRDRADRISDLLAATRVTRREYMAGKLLAALAMLTLIYCAIPAALIAGALLGGGSMHAAVVGAGMPFICVVLPTMLAIGALQFAAGVLSGRLWVIVGQGLVLIWIWTATTGATTLPSRDLLAMLDPFASAPLLVATRDWSDAERSAMAMPVTSLLIANRLLWLAIGTLAAGTAVLRRPARASSVTGASQRVTSAAATRAAPPAVVRARAPHAWRGLVATASYVVQWMLRDAGWRVLTLLGMLNVGVNVAIDAAASGNASLAVSNALQVHSRLFLILLATIYAGELVWREREERSAPFFDTAPIDRTVQHAGRIAGVVAAQCMVVLLLGLTAIVTGVSVRGSAIDMVVIGVHALHAVLLPFVSWLMVSLLVHVVVQQKVVAHLCCIAGWVLAALFFGAADVRVPTSLPVSLLVAASVGSCLLALSVWRRRAAGRPSW